MKVAIILAFLSVASLLFAYHNTKHRAPDNISTHLLLVIVPSFLLQAVGFFAFGIEQRYIDTLSVIDNESLLDYGALALFTLSVAGALLAIQFTRSDKNVVQVNEQVSYAKLIALSFLFTGFSFIGLYVFASSVGSSLPALFLGSSKWLTQADGGSVGFQSNGYARFLTTLGTPALLSYLAYIIYYEKKLTRPKIVLITLLSIAAFVPPALLSSRGAALYAFMSVGFMLLIKRRMSKKFILFGGLSVLILFSALSVARNNFDGRIGVVNALESRVFYGGGVSLFNTSVILSSSARDDFEYKLGLSYLGLLTAPIPRSTWPEKPVFAYDQSIAREIYNIPGDGAQAIPAGLIGESLINFGPILGGPFAVTCLLFTIFIHNRILRMRRAYLSFLLRSIVFPKFAGKLFASGIGFAVMDSILMAIGIVLIYMITKRERISK